VILLLLGAPGSGKGTQGRRLSDHFGIPYLASGDLLRRAIEQGTPLGQEVKYYLERGLYVPNDIMVPAAIEEVQAVRQQSGTDGVVLDGFPRTREQAEATDRALAAEDKQIDRVLFLNVPKEVLIPRLAGRRVCRVCNASYHVETKRPRVEEKCDRCGGALIQRVDDKPEMVEDRLTLYFQQTLPLVAYYQHQGKLVQVDGNRTEDEVTAALVDASLGRQAAPTLR
jgi:adenylate kinase